MDRKVQLSIRELWISIFIICSVFILTWVFDLRIAQRQSSLALKNQKKIQEQIINNATTLQILYDLRMTETINNQ